MKLAEALIRRADAQKRIAQLRQRLNNSAMVQEGTEPAEDPARLLAELDRAIAEMTALVKQINKTNAVTPFDATRTITDVLAERDGILLERSVLQGLVQAATVTTQRYSRSEVKYFATINVAQVQDRIDDLARQHREMDTRIQELNWLVDLIEA
jgi:hypothetical protein